MSSTPLPCDAQAFLAAMSFVMGTVWGSFFNVCIYRVPMRKSIVRPGSHCYACGTAIAWQDNIPLLSYLLLRGNCRSCGSHFSLRYFWIELASGLMFLAIFLRFGLEWVVPFHWMFASLLLVGTFTDMDHYIIPDGITVGGLVFALATALLLNRHAMIAGEFRLACDTAQAFVDFSVAGDRKLPILAPFGWSAASAAFGWALLASIGLLGRILFRKEAMGGGDIKLFAFLGAYLGAINCLWVLFLSAILGLSVGLTLILLHKLMRRDEYEEFDLTPDSAAPPISLRIARSTARQLHHFPFGPYIAVAALLVMFFHQPIERCTRNLLLLPPEREPIGVFVYGPW
jgi:leader peptidase (prepilin peptidase) / N-methyltransferase